MRDVLEHLLYKKKQGCFWVFGNHFWLTMKKLTQRLSITEVGQPRILETLTLYGLTKVSRILVSTNTRLQFINWARLIFANKKIQSKGQSFWRCTQESAKGGVFWDNNVLPQIHTVKVCGASSYFFVTSKQIVFEQASSIVTPFNMIIGLGASNLLNPG